MAIEKSDKILSTCRMGVLVLIVPLWLHVSVTYIFKKIYFIKLQAYHCRDCRRSCKCDRTFRFEEVDYTGFRVNRSCQKNVLKQLVRMAKFGGFSVVVHCRDNPGSSTAYFDCLKILELKLLPTHPVYLLCFTAGLQVFEAWQKVFPGMYFGFSPKIVWGTRHVVFPDVVKRISLSNILLESDCLFLPNRAVGEPKNSPLSIVNVAQKISEVRQKDRIS